MVSSRLVATAAFALMCTTTCGGRVDVSSCEWPISPILVPGQPPFEVAYGTSVSEVTPDPITGSNKYITIMLTRDVNGCPTTYLTTGEVASPMCFLRLDITTAPDGPVTGDFPTSTAGDVRGYSSVGSACVSGSFSPPNFTNIGEATSGVVTITKYVEGAEVAGSFSVVYSDGSTLSGDFDAPYCTAGCSVH